jgi:hypothetical protein
MPAKPADRGASISIRLLIPDTASKGLMKNSKMKFVFSQIYIRPGSVTPG